MKTNLALRVYQLPVDGEDLRAVLKDVNWLTYCLLMCLKQMGQFRLKALHTRKFVTLKICVFSEVSCAQPPHFSSGITARFLPYSG